MAIERRKRKLYIYIYIYIEREREREREREMIPIVAMSQVAKDSKVANTAKENSL